MKGSFFHPGADLQTPVAPSERDEEISVVAVSLAVLLGAAAPAAERAELEEKQLLTQNSYVGNGQNKILFN